MIPDEIAGKYELRGTLGSGAMGTVYEAMDRMIERRVAIKLVRCPPLGDREGEEAHARFRREAQAAGRLAHPSIVGVYDYGENADTAWIVMEFVDGGSLKARFDRGERFPVPEIARLMEQILAAMAYSHARGVVHRDIKPANIMLTSDGPGGPQVKIADFGIARLENSSMTQVGTVMGTPSYMAPEQLRGETVDARVDLWAAGVVLYQFLTGEKPFEGGFSAVMHKALNTEPTPPSQLSVTAPRSFDAVVSRALAKRPEDRFPDAPSFAAAVRAAAAGPAPVADTGRTLGGFAGAGTLPGLDTDSTVISTLRPPPTAAPVAPVAAAPPRRRPAPAVLVGGGTAAVLVAAAAAWFFLAPASTVVTTDPRQTEQQESERRAAEARERQRAEDAARERQRAEDVARERQRAEEAARDAAARLAAEQSARDEAQRAADADRARMAAEARAREEAQRAEQARRQQASQSERDAADRRAREEEARAEAARQESERARAAAAEAARLAEQRAREEASRAEAARQAQLERDRVAAEARAREEARVAAARRQQEEQRAREEAARAEEQRRQQEAARTEEQRRQQDAARAEEQRRQQQEAARAEEQRRQQQEAARAEEQRRQQEAARAEEQRRQQEAALRTKVDPRAAAVAGAAAASCGLLSVTGPAESPTIVGPLRRGGDAAVRSAIAGRGAAPDAVQLRLQPFDGPYCNLLDALRPVAATGDGAPQVNVLGTLPLAKDELLRFDVRMPDAASDLLVSYVTGTGDVLQMVPSRPEAAGARARIGDPRPGFPGFQVDEPYGTDLMLVFTSDRPLFGTPRPQVEPLANYLAALGPALQAARTAGNRVSVRVVVVETVARRR